jgi:signal transduction histidine kinase
VKHFLFTVFSNLFFFLSFYSGAQTHTIRNYTTLQGMPSNEVYHVFQDSKGFIWFGTDNGVVRFDGYQMTVFRTSDGLDDPVVFEIQEDRSGRIWFRTFSNNVFYYEKGKIFPYEYNNILVKACSKFIMLSMAIDSIGQVWFSAFPVTGHISLRGELYTDSLARQRMTVDRIGKKYITGIGWLPVGKDVLVKIDGRTFSIGPHNNAQYGFNHFAVRWNGKLYLTKNDHIFEYDGHSVKLVYTGGHPIICLNVGSDNNLWIGFQNHGLVRYSTADFKDPWTLQRVSNISVSGILKDSEGGLWVTTLENGVFYVPSLSVDLFPYLDSSKVKSILVSGDRVMFGNYKGALLSMDIKTKRSSFEKKFYYPVLKLFNDTQENLWVASGPQVFQFNKKFDLIRKFNVDPVIAFEEYGAGSHRGFSSDGRVYKFTEQKSIDLGFIIDDRLRDILFAEPYVYIAGRLGMHVYDTALRWIEKPAIMSRQKISEMLSLNDTTLLLATIGNGFFVVNNRNWTMRQFSVKNNFIADNIYAAVKTDTIVWFGTEKGALQVSVPSLLNGDLAFKQFNKASGLFADRVNFVALADHEIWTFHDEGISVISPEQISEKHPLPEFYFKTLLINNKEINADDYLDEKPSMPYDSTNVVFTFGFLSFKNQDIIARYRMIEGDPWIYTSDRRVQFTSLAPGAYQFELEYSFDNLHWKAAPSVVEFVVTPPWWQLWYIQLGAFVILGAAVYWVVKNHYNTLHQHEQRLIKAEIETLERERNRIAKELHDGVATNLSAIKLMVSQLLKSHQDPLAEDIDDQILNTITEIKDIIYGLTPPGLERHGLFAGLKNYTDKLNKSIPIKIHLSTLGQEIRDSELGILAFRVIQELLSNAVKHSSARNITIHLTSENCQLNILFTDDGVGFTYEPGKTGLGLTNVESRVKSVRGTLKFESLTGGTRGSTYAICIPLD